MEIQKKNFNLKIGESVNIYFLGDIHEGNCNHADKEFSQAVKIIEADESGNMGRTVRFRSGYDYGSHFIHKKSWLKLNF